MSSTNSRCVSGMSWRMSSRLYPPSSSPAYLAGTIRSTPYGRSPISASIHARSISSCSGEWATAPSTPIPPALLTAATTSRQWLNARIGNSIPNMSVTDVFILPVWPTETGPSAATGGAGLLGPRSPSGVPLWNAGRPPWHTRPMGDVLFGSDEFVRTWGDRVGAIAPDLELLELVDGHEI